MKKASLLEIVDAFRAARTFLVTSHVHPDGDAVGSILAVGHLLRAMGKQAVTCVNDDPVPRIYRWLPGASDIRQSAFRTSLPPVDLAVIIDAAKKDRLGKAADWIPSTARLVVIDHHLEEACDGDLVFLDPSYSAVGEIIVELFSVAGIPIPYEAAVCAYVSIATDTGGFRYANTMPRTHRIAADLLESGIDVVEISSRVFDVISVPKFEMMRRVLDRMQRDTGGRIAHSTIRAQDMIEAGAASEDVDGLVNLPRNIEGVEIGILFREIDPESTKVSIRSRNAFNCARFLARFGGGGHAGAAGVTLAMPVDQARQVIVDSVRLLLGELP